MLGILCVDLGDEAVAKLQAITGSKALMVSRTKASSRRFIYLSEILRKAVTVSQRNFVIVNTNWVRELAEASDDFIAGARAMDRIMLRFGAVNVIRPETYAKAVLKMGTLQGQRRDIVMFNGQNLSRLVELAEDLRATVPEFMLDSKINNISGSPTAKALLVGEKINPYLEFVHWPFFDDRDSAKYISLALEKSNVLESDLAWTNAVHTNESMMAKTIKDLKPSIRVVALGGVAHEKLNDLGIDHTRVAHPQYARRFETYGDYDVVLEQAIRG